MECYIRIKDDYIYQISYAVVGNIMANLGQTKVELDIELIEKINERAFYKIYDIKGNLNQDNLDKYNLFEENKKILELLKIDLVKLKTEYQITDNDLTAINLGIASQEVINNYKAYYAKANELQQQINNLEIENKEILNDIYVGDIN